MLVNYVIQSAGEKASTRQTRPVMDMVGKHQSWEYFRAFLDLGADATEYKIQETTTGCLQISIYNTELWDEAGF